MNITVLEYLTVEINRLRSIIYELENIEDIVEIRNQLLELVGEI